MSAVYEDLLKQVASLTAWPFERSRETGLIYIVDDRKVCWLKGPAGRCLRCLVWLLFEYNVLK